MYVTTWMPMNVGYKLGMQQGVTPSTRAKYSFNERDEELVASSPSQRNWRGIGIALLVILVVCSLIVTAVVLLTPGDTGPRVKGELFSLDDFLGSNFSAGSFNGTWISESEFIFRDHEENLRLYDAEARNSTRLISNEPFRRSGAHIYFLSPDRRYLLLGSEVQKVFRHSFLAKYKIYDTFTDTFYALVTEPGRDDKLQYAKWGPVGNSLVFVYQNNIYYKSSATADTVKQLTASRPEDLVVNGIPDWVYEEEVLSSNHALWFSRSGNMLCFATFNDSLVPVQHFEWFGNPEHPLLYPQPDVVRYPKPNQKNPTAVLWVTDMTKRRSVDLKPPLAVKSQDHYFTAVTWASETELSVVWMNRRQNLSVITICTPPTWFCNESYSEDTKQYGWVDWYEPPVFTSDGKRYLVRGLQKDGEAGQFRQVLLKNVDDRPMKVLTLGKWEVTKINAYDEAAGHIYFTAAPERRPSERHLYRISDRESTTNLTGYCLTCHLAPDCLSVSASFAPGAKYYVLDCNGPGIPKRYLVETAGNTQVAILESNDNLAEHVAMKALPQIKTFRVAVDGGYEAQVRLLLPPGLREDEITQYPLVINVYGGPGSQQVTERFDVDWGTYLSSNMSYIYGMIDGRGSGFQGEKRKFELYRRLGTVEVEDQIDVVRYLGETLKYIDKKRIAIWGWSYGGFVTARVMATDKEVFRCGISVAPVSSWNFYDSIYTERYMGMPTAKDNEEGYARADVLRLAENFRQEKFYLIHGTADDNVHFQQSMLLASALSHANIMFRTQVYPDENHALYGVQKHLYMSMTDFLQDCFRLDPSEEIALQEMSAKQEEQPE